MRYLLLIYGPEPTEDPSPEESAAVMAAYNAFTEHIRSKNAYLGGEALEPTATATTVRVRDGQTLTTDGPFAETKDLIAGWYIIDVESWDRAVELAGELSAAPGPGGKPIHEWLEVRPFWADSPTATE
jgi:hypothetical protein